MLMKKQVSREDKGPRVILGRIGDEYMYTYIYIYIYPFIQGLIMSHCKDSRIPITQTSTRECNKCFFQTLLSWLRYLLASCS